MTRGCSELWICTRAPALRRDARVRCSHQCPLHRCPKRLPANDPGDVPADLCVRLRALAGLRLALTRCAGSSAEHAPRSFEEVEVEECAHRSPPFLELLVPGAARACVQHWKPYMREPAARHGPPLDPTERHQVTSSVGGSATDKSPISLVWLEAAPVTRVTQRLGRQSRDMARLGNLAAMPPWRRPTRHEQRWILPHLARRRAEVWGAETGARGAAHCCEADSAASLGHGSSCRVCRDVVGASGPCHQYAGRFRLLPPWPG
jgi:hypothetical protein